MSTFQFNFFPSESGKKSSSDLADKIEESFECEEWRIPEDFCKDSKCFESEFVDEKNFPDFLKRKYANVLSDLKGNQLAALTEESDVVPNKYEGGLKTWECSIDLLHFLKENSALFRGLESVLEVGCGSGLPGIWCYKNAENPKLFVFQDFNQNVLETVTFPNLLLNCPETANQQNVKFFHGDWKSFPSQLPANRFDLILSSETIYRAESYPLLLDIFSRGLSDKEDARVLVAAKDYYFGLGGSVQQFIKFATLHNWNVTVLRQFPDGVPRSILQLTRK